MNSLFGLKSFDPRSLTELCLSDQNFCDISHPANSTFYVLLARFQVGGILQELLRNSDWKISCLCLITFLPTFSYSLENHASRTEGLELARERDTACANAWVRSFFFKKLSNYQSSDILRRPQKLCPSSTYNLILLSNVKKKEWKIGQIFVAFSEYLNLKSIFNIF